MRVAVVSSMYRKTPPEGYGGIERIIYILVEELVRQGHEVTLFAVPGSCSSARLIEIPGYDSSSPPTGLKKDSDARSEEFLYEVMREFLRTHPVEVIHDWSFENLFVQRHPEKFPFVISTCIQPWPGYQRPNLVACSRAHASLCGSSTLSVYYGLNLDNWHYSYEKKSHFIQLAKIARYKGQHLAVLAARKAGRGLFLAGRIEDRLYHYFLINPLIWFSPGISFLGEIQDPNQYLKEAAALVQTPLRFDPFPLVVLEALAAATPVIAFEQGGIPEQIVDGVNGFLCKTFDDLISAMGRIEEIKPKDCRAVAEEYFSVRRMARDYIELYQRVNDGESW